MRFQLREPLRRLERGAPYSQKQRHGVRGKANLERSFIPSCFLRCVRIGREIGGKKREAVSRGLGREHLLKRLEYGGLGDFGNGSEFRYEPGLVDRSDLVEHDVSILAFEFAGHSGWIGFSARSHRCHYDSANVRVHLVWGDDEAGPGLPDFRAARGVEAHEVNLEAVYHSHSSSSKLVATC